jgi:hypothetical protein
MKTETSNVFRLPLPCRFGWHNYNKWETYKEGLLENGWPVKIQRRKCKDCGYEQMMTIEP